MAKNNIDTNNINVRIRVTDNTGHTTLEQKLEEAMLTITKEHFAQSKWPMVGATLFQFEATGLDDAAGLLADTIRLREMLINAADENGQLTVTLTGPLQGGSR